MGVVTEAIRHKLEAAFAPSRLDIIDDSDKHHGHSGHREGGESHFTVIIESAAFAGVNRVERQRRINAALADLLQTRIHALALRVSAPGEERP